jgi:pimeloyl-ACP methyl ester carboxylesterase
LASITDRSDGIARSHHVVIFAKLGIFPDASHGGIFQYADAFADQTLQFLAQ